jgi:nitrogen regulatory protein PII
MSWGREPLRRTTRAMPKVKEAEPTWSKLKGKGRAKVDNETKEARLERLRKVKAEIAVLQDIVDQLES